METLMQNLTDEQGAEIRKATRVKYSAGRAWEIVDESRF